MDDLLAQYRALFTEIGERHAGVQILLHGYDAPIPGQDDSPGSPPASTTSTTSIAATVSAPTTGTTPRTRPAKASRRSPSASMTISAHCPRRRGGSALDRAALCKRPEELDQAELYAPIWPAVNAHLGRFGIDVYSRR